MTFDSWYGQFLDDIEDELDIETTFCKSKKKKCTCDKEKYNFTNHLETCDLYNPEVDGSGDY